jgi:hypothetical protein
MAELLKLRMNVPEVIALQFATGKIVESTIPNAPNQVMFRLCDGRRTFLPLSAADRIREAGIQPMQEFEIVKAGANDIRVRTFLAANEPQGTPAAIAQRTSAAQSETPRNGNGNTPLPPPPPPAQQAPPPFEPTNNAATNRMMACFKTAIDAIAEAQEYLKNQGIPITLTGDNITSAALSCYINECRNGGGR